jgi:hypothetical protein
MVASDGYSVKVYTVPEVAVEDPFPAPLVNDVPRLSGHPNPFNAAIMLEGRGFPARSGPVVVDVHDILGRRVRRLITPGQGGAIRISWDGRDETGTAAASGVYFFRAHAGAVEAVYKAILIK